MNERNAETFLKHRNLFDKKWKSRSTGASTPAKQLLDSIMKIKGCSFEKACETLEKAVKDGIYVSDGYSFLD